ncbi:putative orphan protein [Pseudoalteromonas translucida]|uniref:Orphan protein n=1 Tax=Pseudoalteromonas translucida (strain TAC 125) TaxID=326442 RepID=Q3IHG7_PSET1|nr:putative orphan protein [Pseudoalteromonas translucida]
MHIKCKLRIHSPLRSSLIATTSSQPFYFKEQKTRFLQMYNS